MSREPLDSPAPPPAPVVEVVSAETHEGGRVFKGRDAILGCPDVQPEDVWVPEWETYVRLRPMSALEREQWETENAAGAGNIRARLVVRLAIDQEGRRLFSDADAKMLGERAVAPLVLLYDRANRLNGLHRTSIEEMGKNSGPGPHGATPSGSPNGSAG